MWGSLREFERDRLGFLTECARRYGDAVHLRFGPKRFLLLADPRVIRAALTARGFSKGYSVRLLRFLLGDGLLTADGERWRAQRKAMQPALARERIEAAIPIVQRCAGQVLGEWSNDATHDTYAEMGRLTLAVAARFVFGVDVLADPAAAHALLAAAAATSDPRPRHVLPFAHLLPTAADRRARRVVRDLDTFVYSLIRRRRAEPSDAEDVLSFQLRTSPAIPDRGLRDDLVTLFFGAYDTTANALAWALHLLARNPDSQERVARECGRVLGDRSPEAADLPGLRFTEAVVFEALRLYPSAWAQSREASHDCEVVGQPVRAGTTVIASQWVTHRDERYFPRADVFLPERWLAEPAPTNAYFPFGAGPRYCIGAGFAMMESVVAVAAVVRQFELTSAGEPAAPEAVVTLRPSSALLVRARRRPAPWAS